MNSPSKMNERQTFHSLQRNTSCYLCLQSSGPTLEPWAFIELLDARASYLTHDAEVLAIGAIDPEVVKQTHNILFPFMIFAVPQPPQCFYFWTVT